MTARRGAFLKATLILLALCTLLAAEVATVFGAEPPALTPTAPACLPKGGNGAILLTVKPETTFSSVRAYFRRVGDANFYFLELRSAGKGAYWATFPKPEPATASVEYLIAVKDAEAKEIKTAAKSIPVTAGCALTLTPDQARYAQNLVVGETVAAQRGLKVAGFECDGIISRLEADGTLRSDDTCRKAMLAKAAAAEDRRKILVPLIIVGGGGGVVAIIRHRDDKEVSKARP